MQHARAGRAHGPGRSGAGNPRGGQVRSTDLRRPTSRYPSTRPGRRGRPLAAPDTARAPGAVLVRPDGFVAWRSAGPSPDPGATLREVLVTLLDRR
ncbi:hypothetical protein EAO69_32085 [Streptomyces sp. me109]|uniref:aromatic-ring hydroxylase C-terminal domain-containing protein n=1 Tax=Streptomyces sp. me109 TaxID=1827853 RepID=UPI0011CDAD5D|nr:hypothetical protein EAO69_32085 [Streptomyces sp. me109]